VPLPLPGERGRREIILAHPLPEVADFPRLGAYWRYRPLARVVYNNLSGGEMKKGKKRKTAAEGREAMSGKIRFRYCGTGGDRDREADWKAVATVDLERDAFVRGIPKGVVIHAVDVLKKDGSVRLWVTARE
jgi:hypothetical protein